MVRINGMKVVFVNSYIRVRGGRVEHVCSHFRSWPGTKFSNN